MADNTTVNITAKVDLDTSGIPDSIPITPTQPAPTSPASPPICPKCGKQHYGNCPQTTNDDDGYTTYPRTTTPPPHRPPVVQPPTPPNNPTGTNTPPPASGGDISPIPTYSRMVDDMRREMRSRGVLLVPGTSNFSQLMTAVSGQQKKTAYDAIESEYGAKRKDLSDQYLQATSEKKDEFEEARQKALALNPDKADTINENFDRRIARVLEDIDNTFKPQFAQLDAEEASDKAEIDKQLTRAIQELTNEFKQGNSNSYLSKLREQYREAVWKRDNAETEKEAREAGNEASAIQRRISRAMGGQGNLLQRMGAGWGTAVGAMNIGMNAYDAYLRNTGMEISELNASANGDAFGAMQQDLQRRRMGYGAWGGGIGGFIGGVVGGILGAIGSYGFGTGAGIGAGAALGGGAGTWIGNSLFSLFHGDEENQVKLGSLWADQEKRIQRFNNLALTMLNTGRYNSIDSWREDFVGKWVIGGEDITHVTDNLDIYDLGYTRPEAAEIISNRIRQRGFITRNENNTDDYRYALQADALEKVYNMSSGSLARLSTYDRYTNQYSGKRDYNANVAMSNLVASLDKMGTIGMSNGQRLRSDEFLGYQTQLMEMQKGWMNPNSEYATQQLLRAQRAFGNDLDSRAISELGQINNAVTSPQEGFTKTLLYDVIQSEFSDTKGNLLAIRQKQFSNNAADRERINRAMLKRIQDIYGGVDTTAGYLALSSYTGIQDPDRLRAWVNEYRNGTPQVTKGNVSGDISGLNGFTPAVSKEMLQYQDETTRLISEGLTELQGIGTTMLTTFKEQLNDIINELR